MSQPQAELYAALINAHTGEIVRRFLSKWHKSSSKLTNSQITLYWINNDNKRLKQWVRNRVIEIQRFTTKSQWFYIQTSDMIADIGTRKGATIQDVDSNSIWINGFEWMKYEESKLPFHSVDAIKFSNSEEREMKQEVILNTASYNTDIVKLSITSEEVKERYQFSNYIIDPHRFHFHIVIRIVAIKFVIKFCKILINRLQFKSTPVNLQTTVSQHPNIHLDDKDIRSAEVYFFKNCTDEVKHFMPSKKYQSFTKEEEGVLYYTGRVLDTRDFTIAGRFNNVMKDLTSISFCVPAVEKHSPVAYAIVNDIHWHHKTAMHSGIETTLRYVNQTAFIIEGRAIVKLVKDVDTSPNEQLM